MIGGVPVPSGDGYKLPTFGSRQRLIGLYQLPDRHLVYEVFFYENGEAKTDYWDPQAARRLFPHQAHAMATSPGGKVGEALRPKSWKKLDGKLFGARGPDGLEINGSYEGGSVCGWAYSTSTDIESSGDVPIRFVLLRKRDVPKEWSSPCGGLGARLHFEEVIPHVVATGGQGFLATLNDESVLLKFDWDGHADFLKGRDDIIAVPYRALRDCRGEEDGEIDVAKAEAMIARVAQNQRNGVLANLKWSQ